MNRNIFWMIIGCGIPLLLIFFAPVVGLGSGVSLLLFIIGMLVWHLLMPMHPYGGHNREQNKQNSQTTKIENHEHHH